MGTVLGPLFPRPINSGCPKIELENSVHRAPSEAVLALWVYTATFSAQKASTVGGMAAIETG